MTAQSRPSGEHRSAIEIDPAWLGGTPRVRGSRISCDHAAGCMWAERSVDTYMGYYGFEGEDDRRAVLVAAAWWVLNDKGRSKSDRELRTRWSEWAEGVWARAWHYSDRLPDPPFEEAS